MKRTVFQRIVWSGILAAVLAGLSMPSFAEKADDGIIASGESRVLSCEGEMVTSVPEKDIPKSIKELYKGGKKDVSQIYEIKENKLIGKVGNGYPDITLTLCKKSESEYVFSTDCWINKRKYLYDWFSEEVHSIGLDKSTAYPSLFFRKYGNPSDVLGSYEVININRFNLHVTDDSYSPQVNYGGNKSSGYMVISKAELHCTVQKPKI